MGILLSVYNAAGTFATLYSFISGKLKDDSKVFKKQLKKNINVICEAAINDLKKSPELNSLFPSSINETIYNEVIRVLENKEQINIDNLQKELECPRRDILEQLVASIDEKLQTSLEYCQRDYNAWSRQETSDIKLLLFEIKNIVNDSANMQNVILNKIEEKSSLVMQTVNDSINKSDKISEELGNLLTIFNRTTNPLSSVELAKFNSQMIFSAKNRVSEALLTMNNGSNRQKPISELINMLINYSWIHIYGEIWSGKTQLLALLAERIGNVEFIDLELYSINQINNIINNIEEESVLVIDNLPNVSSEHIKSLISTVKTINNKNVKVVSSGYNDLKLLRDYNTDNFFVSYPIPFFTMDEVVEVLKRNKMPDSFKYSSLVEYFEILCKQSPALLMEIVYYLIDNDWRIEIEFWDMLFSQKFKYLEEKMESLLFKRLDDNESRKLLYRIAYVGYKLSDKNISDIAKIGLEIENWEQRINILKGSWLTPTENGYYDVRKEINKISQRNLSNDEKKLIDKYMVEFLKTKTLDYLDFLQLLGHYKNLKEYDMMGHCCFQFIQQAIKDGYKDAPEYITNFWISTPMPPMSSFVKFLFRISQLQYLEICEKDNSKVMSEFIDLLETDDEIVYLLPIGAIMTSFNSVSISLELFKLCQKNSSWYKFKEKYSHLYNEIDFSLFNDIDNLRELCLLSIMIKTKTITYGESIYEIIKTIKPDEIQTMENNASFCSSWGIMLEKIRLNITLEENIRFEYLLLDMLIFFERIEAIKLYGIIFRSWLRYFSNNLEDYDTVRDEYEKRIRVVEKHIEANEMAIDTMGKIALDFNDNERGLELLSNRISNIQIDLENKDDTKFNDVCTCIAFLQRSLLNPEKMTDIILEAQEKLHMLSQVDDEFIPSPVGNEMIMGEYFISMYLLGNFEKCYLDFANFVEQILTESRRNIRDVQELVAVLSHCITYIKADILYKNPPLFIGDEKYAPPEMSMFWAFERNEKLHSYDTNDRRLMIRLALADMAQYYQFDDIARRNILEVIKHDIKNTSILVYFILYPHFRIQLLQMNKFNELANITLKAENYIASGNHDVSFYDFKSTAMILLVNTLYLVWVCQLKGEDSFLSVSKKMIKSNLMLENEQLSSKYYKEYHKLLQMFIDEGLDSDLFSYAYDLINKKNEISDMCNIIYPFYLLVSRDEHKKAYIENIKKLIDNYGFARDYLLQRFINDLEVINSVV